MIVMTSPPGLPMSRPLTAADLASMPDDGHRYELIDGSLIVTPSPAIPHQRVVGNLYSALRSVCPPGLEVMFAPLDVTVSDSTVLQPDVLVASRDALAGRRMVGVPVLAVEVASPSTHLIDRNLKHAALERAGVASYWIVDPGGPSGTTSIIAWELDEGRYRVVATAVGEAELVVERPFPVRLRPVDLTR